MLVKNRTAYDFLASIVEECTKVIGKTDLYYKMKTHHTIFERSLNQALRFRLIENIGEKYCTTPKGGNFLIVWEKLQTFLRVE